MRPRATGGPDDVTAPDGPRRPDRHGWTFPYSSSGNLDVMTFIPLVAGTYTAFDPVNPRFVGEIVVR